MASAVSGIYNRMVDSKIVATTLKKAIGFATDRSLPLVYKQTFRKWLRRNLEMLNGEIKRPVGKVYLFVDEFTNYNDVPVGVSVVRLLNKLRYKVLVLNNADSGRALLSKGFLKKAKNIAGKQVDLYASKISSDIPLIGIEPSAILAFRDEYPDLLRGEKKKKALEIARHSYTFDEFIVREVEKGNISPRKFHNNTAKVLFHGHCQQKAVGTSESMIKCLSLPENYSVEEIKSGCCGMAGSFGYEKEHYDLSVKIGEMVLFPAVRNAEEETIIVAPGTSCRHQIKDGTGRNSLHPAEVLFEALK
jgi:Fe-S oxidoreductase